MEVTRPVSIYAAADPTEAYTFSDPIDFGNHPLATVTVTTSGNVPTSFEAKRQWCDADDAAAAAAATWTDESDEGVTPGARLHKKVDPITIEDAAGSPANGTYDVRFERWSRRWGRLAIKRTGGAVGTRVAMTATKAAR